MSEGELPSNEQPSVPQLVGAQRERHEAAWAAEIERRARRFLAGESQGIEWGYNNWVIILSLRTGDRFHLHEPVWRNKTGDEHRCNCRPDAIEKLLAHLYQSAHVLTSHQVEGHLHNVRQRHIGGTQDGRDVQERLFALSTEIGWQMAFRRLADLSGDV